MIKKITNIKNNKIELSCLFCGGNTETDKEIHEKYVNLSQYNPKKELVPQLICPHCSTINRLVIKSQSDKAVKKKSIFTKGLSLFSLFIIKPIERIFDLVAFIVANFVGGIIKYHWIKFINNLVKDIIELTIFGYIYYLTPKTEIGIFLLVYLAIQKRCLVINIGESR